MNIISKENRKILLITKWFTLPRKIGISMYYSWGFEGGKSVIRETNQRLGSIATDVGKIVTLWP